MAEGGVYGNKAAQERCIGGGRRGGKEQEGWGRRSEAGAEAEAAAAR